MISDAVAGLWSERRFTLAPRAAALRSLGMGVEKLTLLLLTRVTSLKKPTSPQANAPDVLDRPQCEVACGIQIEIAMDDTLITQRQ